MWGSTDKLKMHIREILKITHKGIKSQQRRWNKIPESTQLPQKKAERRKGEQRTDRTNRSQHSLNPKPLNNFNGLKTLILKERDYQARLKKHDKCMLYTNVILHI